MLTTLLIVSILFGTAYARGVITLTNNEKRISTDVAPQIINGRVMVPLSVISKELGPEVSWNQKSKTVNVNNYGMPYENVWNETIDSIT